MESTLNEINAAKEYLESIKTRIESGDDDEECDADNIAFVLMQIKAGPMIWLNIEKQFSELNIATEPLNQIVRSLKSKAESDNDSDLRGSLEKVEVARMGLNELEEHLKKNALIQASSTLKTVDKIKTIISANPDNFTEELEEMEDAFKDMATQAIKMPKQLTDLMEKSYMQAILHLWNAELAVESLKSTYPSESEDLKQILKKSEEKLYSLRKETRKLLNKVKWLLASRSKDGDPPEEVLTVEKCNMYTNVCEVVDLSEPVAKDKREIITHLAEILEGKAPEVILQMNRVAEEMKSKYPEDTQLEGFVKEKLVKFDQMKDAVKTVADKIKLDAQNEATETAESTGFYTQMFNYVVNEKILTFMGVRLRDIKFELAPVRDESEDPTREFMEEISEGPLSDFEHECFEEFDYLSLMVQELGADEYEYLTYM